jgi:sugar/nucleoside kinase (ribokinase family)
MSDGKFIISGTGCALADYLYPGLSFNAPQFAAYLSRETGDGGLSPGKLVFTEELEKFAGKPYLDILKELTGGADPSTFNIGGPGLVSLIHAAQLLESQKYEVRFFGMTGTDDTATRIMDMVKQTPLQVANYRQGSSRATPFTDVFSDPNYDNGHGERTFVNNIGAAWDYSPDNLSEQFFESRIVCFGGTALVPQIHDNLTQLLRKAKKNHCITVVNTVYDFRNEKNNPGKPWPLVEEPRDYALIDVLIMDKEEALKISGKDTIRDAARYFEETGVSSFFITNGAESVTLYSDGEFFNWFPVQSFPVSQKVKECSNRTGDTTGCGDNFAGGLIASLAEQLSQDKMQNPDLMEALAWAVASGGFACYYYGGTWFEQCAGQKRELVLPYRQDYLEQIKPL